MSKSMKIVNIVGARPQFIKAAPVSQALREAGHREFLLHTGQHYDRNMSQVFFDELNIREPDINLGVGSGPHGLQTGKMLMEIEKTLLETQPDWVLVYGDTNSTLAGALAASKLHLPLAHVEAGLRSFNREMPEEHNRVLTDHCSDLLLCPTKKAVANLEREGITVDVALVGDTMYDAVLQFSRLAHERSTILQHLGLLPKQYLLATVHRASNTDELENLGQILTAFADVGDLVIFPVHPRTRKRMADLNGKFGSIRSSTNVRLIGPVGYPDMLMLEQNARAILTDSGGIQKEAYFFSTPCITLRSETEWTETVQTGWNVVTGLEPRSIMDAICKTDWPATPPPPVFGQGDAAQRVVQMLRDNR